MNEKWEEIIDFFWNVLKLMGYVAAIAGLICGIVLMVSLTALIVRVLSGQ